MSAIATAVHHLIGVRRYTRCLGDTARILITFIAIGVIFNYLILAMMTIESNGIARFLYFEMMFNETPRRFRTSVSFIVTSHFLAIIEHTII